MTHAVEVRFAVQSDAGAIAKLRDDFYQDRGLPVQERSEVSWLVAVYDGRIVATEAYRDGEGQRWQTDFYREPGRYGTIGAALIMNHVERTAKAAGLKQLFGVTCDARNFAAALAHGWLDGGHVIYKPLED